jgi:hypothetical protein
MDCSLNRPASTGCTTDIFVVGERIEGICGINISGYFDVFTAIMELLSLFAEEYTFGSIEFITLSNCK